MWTVETVITIASLLTNLIQTVALAYIRQRYRSGRSLPPPPECPNDDDHENMSVTTARKSRSDV